MPEERFKDPIVEEVRRIRKEIEAECDNDWAKYFDRLRKLEAKYKDRIVDRGPVRIKRSQVG